MALILVETQYDVAFKTQKKIAQAIKEVFNEAGALRADSFFDIAFSNVSKRFCIYGNEEAIERPVSTDPKEGKRETLDYIRLQIIDVREEMSISKELQAELAGSLAKKMSNIVSVTLPFAEVGFCAVPADKLESFSGGISCRDDNFDSKLSALLRNQTPAP